jgi:hypothetical protein
MHSETREVAKARRCSALESMIKRSVIVPESNGKPSGFMGENNCSKLCI